MRISSAVLLLAAVYVGTLSLMDAVPLNEGSFELSQFLHKHKVVDFTRNCTRNESLKMLLTLGHGVSDSVIVMIAEDPDYLYSCSLSILAAEGVIIVIVIEFLGELKSRGICMSSTVQVYGIRDRDDNHNACLDMSNSNDHRALYVGDKTNATIVVNSIHDYESIKIIATIARQLDAMDECAHDEVYCRVKELEGNTMDVCITKAVMCDDHYNCNAPSKFDEDLYTCHSKWFLWQQWILVVGLICTIVTVVLAIRICWSSVPTVSDFYFNFNADEDNKLNLVDVKSSRASSSAPSLHIRLTPKESMYRHRSSEGNSVIQEK